MEGELKNFNFCFFLSIYENTGVRRGILKYFWFVFDGFEDTRA